MGTKLELVTLLLDYTNNDADKFQLHIPDFIRSSEERIWYFIQVPKFKKRVTGAFTASIDMLDLPDDFLALAVLSVKDGDVYYPVDNKDESFIREVCPDPTIEGRPRFYAQLDDDTVLAGPVPDSGYPVLMTYFYKPPSLAGLGDDDETWLSKNSFEALKFGALMEAAIYMKRPSEEYEKQFMACLTGLKNLGEVRLRRDINRTGEK